MLKLRRKPCLLFWSEEISQVSLTDHKPLLAIPRPKSAIPTLAALRLQWWALILMAYNYEIEYRQSADHANADALYSLPSKGGDGTAEEEKIFYFSIMEDLSVKAKDIGHSTNKDLVLSQVRELTLNGWPSYVREETLKQFFTEELSYLWSKVVFSME